MIECIKVFLNLFMWICKFFFRHRQYKLDKKLLSCCRERNLDGAEEALMNGADVNTKGVDGRTPLIVVCTLNLPHRPSDDDSFDLVHLLFRYGFERQGETRLQLNARDNKGNTALMMASRNGAARIVDALCAAHAEVNLHNNKGHSALYRAEKHGYTETARILRKYGAH